MFEFSVSGTSFGVEHPGPSPLSPATPSG